MKTGRLYDYGIPPDEVRRSWILQGKRCQGCGDEISLEPTTTGGVKQPREANIHERHPLVGSDKIVEALCLLCFSCNTGLGFLDDDLHRLEGLKKLLLGEVRGGYWDWLLPKGCLLDLHFDRDGNALVEHAIDDSVEATIGTDWNDECRKLLFGDILEKVITKLDGDNRPLIPLTEDELQILLLSRGKCPFNSEMGYLIKSWIRYRNIDECWLEKWNKIKHQVDSILPVNWVQCDECKKWRKLPLNMEMDDLSDVWHCSNNIWDMDLTCQSPEDNEEDPPSFVPWSLLEDDTEDYTGSFDTSTLLLGSDETCSKRTIEEHNDDISPPEKVPVHRLPIKKRKVELACANSDRNYVARNEYQRPNSRYTVPGPGNDEDPLWYPSNDGNLLALRMVNKFNFDCWMMSPEDIPTPLKKYGMRGNPPDRRYSDLTVDIEKYYDVTQCGNCALNCAIYGLTKLDTSALIQNNTQVRKTIVDYYREHSDGKLNHLKDSIETRSSVLDLHSDVDVLDTIYSPGRDYEGGCDLIEWADDLALLLFAHAYNVNIVVWKPHEYDANGSHYMAFHAYLWMFNGEWKLEFINGGKEVYAEKIPHWRSQRNSGHDGRPTIHIAHFSPITGGDIPVDLRFTFREESEAIREEFEAKHYMLLEMKPGISDTRCQLDPLIPIRDMMEETAKNMGYSDQRATAAASDAFNIIKSF